MDLMGSISGVLITLNGIGFDHQRGDLDSPYCEDDASCADGDLCTADSCSPGGCRHNPIPGCCVSDSQCDDGNACTLDQCVDNQCASVPLNLDDSNPCTEDQCDPVTGPSHNPLPDCCLSDSDCNGDGTAPTAGRKSKTIR
jgi:slime mold repeat-containing protein